MASQTPNYQLTKPTYAETADIVTINGNMDIIDTKMKDIEDKAEAAKGAPNIAHCTTKNITLYVGYNLNATGTANISGTTTVTGISTLFATELQVGEYICINNEIRQITSIANNTSLSVSTAFSSTTSGQILTICRSGSNNNDGSAPNVDHALATIQAAINKIPQFVNHMVTINVAKGYYNEDVVVNGFVGGGGIALNGKASGYHEYTEQWSVKSICVAKTSCPVNIYGFRFFTTNQAAITVANSSNISVNGNSVVANSNVYAAVYCGTCGTVGIWGNSFSNRYYGIVATYSALVVSNTNYGASNQYALFADIGSTIAKYDTCQPGGAIAETAMHGGVIR